MIKSVIAGTGFMGRVHLEAVRRLGFVDAEMIEPLQDWKRVLADPSSQGATYLDLRIPGRVAAGGLAPATDSNPQVDPQNGPTLNQG